MNRFKESTKADKAKNYFVGYIKWMVTGKYIRFLKIMFTGLWLTALVTLQFDVFIYVLFGSFLAREVGLILFKKDYEVEDSWIKKLSDISDD